MRFVLVSVVCEIESKYENAIDRMSVAHRPLTIEIGFLASFHENTQRNECHQQYGCSDSCAGHQQNIRLRHFGRVAVLCDDVRIDGTLRRRFCKFEENT